MQTPLYLAVSKLKHECAMKLLDAGANVHHADDARRTPLHAAMQHGEGGDALLALLNRLLQLGARRRRRRPRAAHAAHWASGKDALPLVTALITAKADVNAMDWAQHAAPLGVPDGRPECAGALLAAKAIPSAQDRDQRTPLHWAADKAALKCLTLLLGQTGISVRARPAPTSPLAPRRARSRAARPSPAPRRSPPLALPQLSPPCQVDAVDWGGFSALHYAARATRASASRLSSRRAPTAASSPTRTSSRSTWPPRPT